MTSNLPSRGLVVSKADRLRERELLRYYQPTDDRNSEVITADQASSPDTTLTALAQLVAIRLNVKSVLINVITKDTQFTLSEGTKTLNLADTRKSDLEKDALWIGCGSLPKNEALCETTIALPTVPGGLSPFFTVPDLSKDSKFRNLFYVKNTPNWRFYSGCPLTTKSGVNIGALCILDDKPRSGLTEDQKEFATTISHIIMRHLETRREAAERKKGTRMSRGLNAFVEGKTWLTSEDLMIDDVSTSKTDWAKSRGELSLGLSSNMARTRPSRDSSGGTPPSPEGAEAEPLHKDIDIQQRVTFSRAANLLRKSLDIQSGGVVFLDTIIGLNRAERDSATSASSADVRCPEDIAGKGPSPKTYNRSSFESSMLPENNQRKAGVLGKCTDSVYSSPVGSSNIPPFTPLGDCALAELIKKYPRGKLWSFDEDGCLSSSEEEQCEESLSKSSGKAVGKRTGRKLAEAKLLQVCFPRVRQLLFCPMWDAGSARYFSGCFAWTTSPLQIFSTETELSFLIAFGNSIMAEVSRLATIAADQQKGDFIGSISHELRSPLHGILASSEFLGETECDSFQTSLVDTIDSCGRTLLDTINHVLDFSKINSFEKGFKKKGAHRHTSMTSPTAVPQMPQIMNIYATTDIAAICEEVVEGVYAGQVYQDISSTSIGDLAPGARGGTFERGLVMANRSLLGGSGAQFAKKAVDVVLDIEPDDYIFTTQPGALRRVVMNLVTNALKYTEQGMVLVKLSLRRLESSQVADNNYGRTLELIVRDTGKGISSHYLRTRLFTPFAQENTLAPGIGLGLSIVRSITNMLGGSIDIKSEVDRGTEVKISLPLLRVSGIDTPVSTPNSTSSLERTSDDSIGSIQAESTGKSVAFYGFETTLHEAADVSTAEVEKVLKQYTQKWYGLEVLTPWPPRSTPDVVIVDEKKLSKLLSYGSHDYSIIALCTYGSRHGQQQVQDNTTKVEFLSKPFGPFKLAKVIRHCLKQTKPACNGIAPLTELSRTNSTNPSELPHIEFEALTLMSEGDSVPINAQTTGTITAGDSENALLAVESLSGGGSTSTERADEAFPFPPADDPSSTARHSNAMHRRASGRPALKQRKTDPIQRNQGWHSTESPSSSRKEQRPPLSAPSSVSKRPPRILLVDDNKINLRLLKTLMMKRECQLVDLADNGQSAVQAAEMQTAGYDVIFMDISMPVMNGFEATRAIRLIEENRRTGGPDDPPPALIIALTGLASSRDQSEAFTSGVDLFMTKPVSFKEVGRLLDNWEANAGNVGVLRKQQL